MIAIQDRTRLKERLTKYLGEAKGQTSSICDSILIHLEQHKDHHLVKIIIDDLTVALRSLTSQTVLQASRLLDLLARSQNQQLSLAFNEKEFQESMLFALRGKLTNIMNKLTLHPMAWQEIEQTLLALYQWWFFQLVNEQAKYHLILQNYRQLRKIGVQFPPMEERFVRTEQKNEGKNEEVTKAKTQPTTINSKEQPTNITKAKKAATISEQQIEQLQKLALSSELQLKKQQYDQLLTTDNVRLIKSKVALLYEIFSKGNLDAVIKQQVKQLYSRLRAILKELDKQNGMIKLQKQKEYMEQKKGISSIKNLSKESPTKKVENTNDLLDGDKEVKNTAQEAKEMPKMPLPAAENIKSFEDIFGSEKPDDDFSQFQSSQPEIAQNQLLDLNANPIKPVLQQKPRIEDSPQKEPISSKDAPLIDIEPVKQEPKSPPKPQPLKQIPVDFTL